MASSASVPAATIPSGERALPAAASVSWPIWCAVAACVSAVFGVEWDISWHQSIGRDTLWSPPHMAIYLSGVLAGVASGYLILSTTLGADPRARQVSVAMWGFRGPLGAFLCAWGCFAMLASAPFDDWWHNAYGLDVKIMSPPHVILGVGVLAVRLGALLLILGRMNRAEGPLRRKLQWVFLAVGAQFIIGLLILLTEQLLRVYMHSARFYLLLSIPVPLILAAIWRACPARWTATIVTGIYTGFVLGLVWILPLFPAEPKLGPVYQKVTHFIPPEFPLLLIAPGLALDWLRARIGRWKPWAHAFLAGLVFLATLLAAQWPWASFLQSAGARNWFFGAHYFGYFVEPSSPYVRYQFVPLEPGWPDFWLRLAIALGGAILSTRAGLAVGGWMGRVRR